MPSPDLQKRLIFAMGNSVGAGAELISLLTGAMSGNAFYVNPSGSNNKPGTSAADAFATLTYALTKVSSGDVIYLAPGRYDESPTISRSLNHITIIGTNGRGAAYIDPSTEDADGLTVHADDVTLINVGVAAEDETSGNYSLQVTGSRFRAYGCKIEGGEQQIRIGPGTVAQEAAGTHGVAGDCLFYDCEVCWGTTGVMLVCTDYGAVTQLRIERTRFHNLTSKHVTEVAGSGGSAAVMFTNLQLIENTHDDLEDGTAPTNYIDLNGDNANSGIVTDCRFPTAINSTLNLVSTALHWVCNRHTGGISTGQPS
jgi:hypothetical protein